MNETNSNSAAPQAASVPAPGENPAVTYSVGELVTELGVARTTLNDWLSRYESYLESELRGRRKVYTTHALTILREIADARSAGKSSFEIETLLTSKYGVHPEIAPAAPQENGSEATDAPPSTSDNSTLPAVTDAAIASDRITAEQLLPITREMSSEIRRTFSDEFKIMAAALDESTRGHLKLQKQMRIFYFWAAIGIVVLIVLAVALVSVYRNWFDAIGHQNETQQQAQNFLQEQNRKTVNDVNASIASLDSTLSGAIKNFETRLTTEQTRHQGDLDRALEASRKELSQLKEELQKERTASSEKMQKIEQLIESGQNDKTALAQQLEQAGKEYEAKMQALQKSLDANAAALKKAQAAQVQAQAAATAAKEELEALRQKELDAATQPPATTATPLAQPTK